MHTTIQIKDKTLSRLKYFKESSKESYDEILNKIMDDIEEGQMTDEAIEDIRTGLQEIKDGKGEAIEDVAKEFGISL
tara:strand:- start:2372 stop:2602 length:231 start_codon:yes stop_codon:yes gene_type:complete